VLALLLLNQLMNWRYAGSSRGHYLQNPLPDVIEMSRSDATRTEDRDSALDKSRAKAAKGASFRPGQAPRCGMDVRVLRPPQAFTSNRAICRITPVLGLQSVKLSRVSSAR